MEALFVEEVRSSISTLMANLESVPVTKGSESRAPSALSSRFKKYGRVPGSSVRNKDQNHDDNHETNHVHKMDIQLNFSLEVRSLLSSLSLSLHWSSKVRFFSFERY